MADSTWNKIQDMVTAWVEGKLKDPEGTVARVHEADFFNNLFMRAFRGLSDVEVETVVDEILEGRCFVKTNPGYDGRMGVIQRCIDVKAVNYIRPQILALASSLHRKVYHDWSVLESLYPALSYKTVLIWTTIHREWIKKNKDKLGISSDMPMALRGILQSILVPSTPSPDTKFRVENLPANGFQTSVAQVSSNLAIIDARHLKPEWDERQFMSCFDYIANINHASYYWIMCLVTPQGYSVCYQALRRVDGGKEIYVGTYDPPTDPARTRKCHVYFVLAMLVIKTDATTEPKVTFDLRLNALNFPVDKVPVHPPSVMENWLNPVLPHRERYESWIEMIFCKPMCFSSVGMKQKVDNVVKHAIPSHIAQHLVQTFNEEGLTVLDFFGGGTFGRAAMSLEQDCICFEYSEEVCRFLTAALSQIQETVYLPPVGNVGLEVVEQKDPTIKRLELRQMDDDDTGGGPSQLTVIPSARLQDDDDNFEREYMVAETVDWDILRDREQKKGAANQLFENTEEFDNAREQVEQFHQAQLLNRRALTHGEGTSRDMGNVRSPQKNAGQSTTDQPLPEDGTQDGSTPQPTGLEFQAGDEVKETQ